MDSLPAELPESNAEDVGSIPGQGTEVPYATVQLSTRCDC